MTELRFNVLTDPWIPLDVDGRAQYASYVELLTGERDAEDLVHPRDDVRFYARMLLSALTQALFPAKDAKALRQRIAEPLPRAVVEERIARIKEDFELVGKGAFMQEDLSEAELAEAKPDDLTSNDTAFLVLGWPRNTYHLLFRPAGRCNAICPPCALMVLYGIQSFAPQDGRSGFGLGGKYPAIRRGPAITTLVSLRSVRETMWANTLHEQYQQRYAYAADSERPWTQRRIIKQPGEPFGLLEGLFWQPRAFHFEATDEGPCDLCGKHGPRVVARAFRSKSQATNGAFYRHPWSPVWESTSPKSRRPCLFRNFPTDRPAWTGFIDLVSEARGTGKQGKYVARPAPVVRQWVESVERGAEASLLVLDYATKQAIVRRRVCESFPLSSGLADPDAGEYVRSLTARAEATLERLEDALKEVRERPTEAKGKKKRGEPGYWLADARAGFWQATESRFWVAVDAYLDGELEEDAAFAKSLREVALQIFDAHTRSSDHDPQRMAQIVMARRRMSRALTRELNLPQAREETTGVANAVA